MVQKDFNNVTVTIKGQRNLELNGIVTNDGIEVEGHVYYFNPNKGERSCEDIKVLIKKYCENEVVYGGKCNDHKNYS